MKELRPIVSRLEISYMQTHSNAEIQDSSCQDQLLPEVLKCKEDKDLKAVTQGEAVVEEEASVEAVEAAVASVEAAEEASAVAEVAPEDSEEALVDSEVVAAVEDTEIISHLCRL